MDRIVSYGLFITNLYVLNSTVYVLLPTTVSTHPSSPCVTGCLFHLEPQSDLPSTYLVIIVVVIDYK